MRSGTCRRRPASERRSGGGGHASSRAVRTRKGGTFRPLDGGGGGDTRSNGGDTSSVVRAAETGGRAACSHGGARGCRRLVAPAQNGEETRRVLAAGTPPPPNRSAASSRRGQRCSERARVHAPRRVVEELEREPVDVVDDEQKMDDALERGLQLAPARHGAHDVADVRDLVRGRQRRGTVWVSARCVRPVPHATSLAAFAVPGSSTTSRRR